VANPTLTKAREGSVEPVGERPLLQEVEAPALDGFAGMEAGADVRRVAIYDPHAVFGLVDELEHLGARALEPNVFFTPRFLAPAMPRLDERHVRLMVARDEDDRRSRLRFLMPFTVERLERPSRRAAVRAWTHPFGPLGSLLLDQDDPAGTARSLFEALRTPEHRLPLLLVLPDLPFGGDLAKVFTQTARAAGMPLAWADRSSRAFLDARDRDPHEALAEALGPASFRDYRRRLRQLSERGPLAFEYARSPGDVRQALEDFLHLEASGWKGQRRSALLLDRHRAAFAREAVNGLAERDMARVYTLRAGGEAAASLVVLHSQGHAVAWKTAYDERLRRYGPGALVATLATRALIADPDIDTADSCAVPDQRVMNRLWRGRIAIGTLVIGLDDRRGEDVADAVAAIEGARRRLNRRRIWRERLRGLWSAGR
jgi:hypothetical protein